jgi:hypothetical protein
MESLAKVAKGAAPETNVCWSGATRLAKSAESKEPAEKPNKRQPACAG